MTDPLDDPFVVEHTNAIHLLAKRTIADVIEIGVRMAAVKHRLGRPDWLRWLEREGCTEQTALNYMRTAELNESKTVLVDLELPLKALYLLAAPSTPPVVREELIARAEAGEPVTAADVKSAITAAKEPEPATEPEHEPTAVPVRTEPEPKPRHGINQAVIPLFKSEDRLDAFCDAVRTRAAKRFITLDQQLELAKDIVKKRIRAQHIEPWISNYVRDAARAQGKIDEVEEKDFYKQFPGYEIRDEVAAVESIARSLSGSLLKLRDHFKTFPGHLFFGNLVHTLDDIITVIRQYRRETGEKGDKLERELAQLEELKRKIEHQKIAIEELRRENEELRAKLDEAEKAPR